MPISEATVPTTFLLERDILHSDTYYPLTVGEQVYPWDSSLRSFGRKILLNQKHLRVSRHTFCDPQTDGHTHIYILCRCILAETRVISGER